jgi:hypothetical protein
METAAPAAQGTENDGDQSAPTTAEPMEDVSYFHFSTTNSYFLFNKECSTYKWYCSW